MGCRSHVSWKQKSISNENGSKGKTEKQNDEQEFGISPRILPVSRCAPLTLAEDPQLIPAASCLQDFRALPGVGRRNSRPSGHTGPAPTPSDPAAEHRGLAEGQPPGLNGHGHPVRLGTGYPGSPDLCAGVTDRHTADNVKEINICLLT